MKTLNFNKNSIHFRLANMYDDFDCNDDHDLCSYTKYVLCGFVLSLMVLALGIGAWHLLVSTVLAVVFSIMYGTLIYDVSALVGGTFISFALFFTIHDFSSNYLDERRCARKKKVRELGLPPKPDGFLVNAFKSWKEKYCVRVTFGE